MGYEGPKYLVYDAFGEAYLKRYLLLKYLWIISFGFYQKYTSKKPFLGCLYCTKTHLDGALLNVPISTIFGTFLDIWMWLLIRIRRGHRDQIFKTFNWWQNYNLHKISFLPVNLSQKDRSASQIRKMTKKKNAMKNIQIINPCIWSYWDVFGEIIW